MLNPPVVTVFTTPSCSRCDLTKKAFTNAGVPFGVVDVSEDAQALEMVKSLGHSSAPVVIVEGIEDWSGFRPDHIARTASLFAPVAA